MLIRELMSLNPVAEADVDNLFGEVERIRDMYSKAGTTIDELSERWIKAVMLQNLPDSILRLVQWNLKRQNQLRKMHGIINIYKFDRKTGFLRGQHGPGFYVTESSTEKEDDSNTSGAENEGGGGQIVNHSNINDGGKGRQQRRRRIVHISMGPSMTRPTSNATHALLWLALKMLSPWVVAVHPSGCHRPTILPLFW